MKKVNFKKRVSQLMAGVFGLALMGGVMLSSQEVAANINIGMVDRRAWTPVYEGNTTPQYDYCANSFWSSECVVGDTRNDKRPKKDREECTAAH